MNRKASWLLALILLLGVSGPLSAQADPPNRPDSLFNRVNLDTLPPLGNKKQNIWNAINNKPFNKAIQPVQVKNASQHLLQNSSINLLIPGRSKMEFMQKEVIWSDSSHYQWIGRSESEPATLKLVVRNDRLTGTLKIDTANYRIQPLGDVIGPVKRVKNVHVITRLDFSGITMTDTVQKGRVKKKAGMSTQSRMGNEDRLKADKKTDQGIMVIYTDNVAAKVAEPKSLVQSAVTDVNNAYSNSGIPIDLTLVHTREMKYEESSDTDTDLKRLQDSTDGFIDEVHSYRDKYGADIVVMLTANTQSDQSGTVTGEAYEIMADSSTAFAVVRYDFAEAPVYTLAHEVGHLQGADHNPKDEVNPYKSYGHGYTYPEDEWRTIMAYNVDGCCSRIEFFSNPDFTYNGDPLGTSTKSDNARLLTETASTIAEFRPPFPLEVLIQGPSYVRTGSTGVWEADVTGGIKPYSHTWYRRYSENNSWNKVGQSDSLKLVVENHFQLKLVSTDEKGKTRESSVFDVYTNIKSNLEPPSVQPTEYRLYSNYPNPFNPSTKITYYLPEAAFVKMEVYTVNGRKVRTVMDQLQSHGKHQLIYEAADLPTGLYILRMTAKGKATGQTINRMIKMTLLK